MLRSGTRLISTFPAAPPGLTALVAVAVVRRVLAGLVAVMTLELRLETAVAVVAAVAACLSCNLDEERNPVVRLR